MTSGYFRAVAVDFDGTLTEGARPDEAVLEAIAELRGRGVRVILATGRILSELRHGFADVDEHFDSIVAENGALDQRPARATAPRRPGRRTARGRTAAPTRPRPSRRGAAGLRRCP